MYVVVKVIAWYSGWQCGNRHYGFGIMAIILRLQVVPRVAGPARRQAVTYVFGVGTGSSAGKRGKAMRPSGPRGTASSVVDGQAGPQADNQQLPLARRSEPAAAPWTPCIPPMASP